MFKKISLATVIITFLLILSTPIFVAQAQTVTSIVDTTNPKYELGTYTLDDFTIMAIRGSKWVLGIVGSLALLMFIYGGIMFLISAGNSQSIEQAKKILLAAVIGLLIVFSSFLIIKFVLQSMNINWDGQRMIMTPQGLVPDNNNQTN